MAAAITRFTRFKSVEASCFKPSDKDHLLSVIETGFGSLERFDELVRAAFVGRLEQVQQQMEDGWLQHAREVMQKASDEHDNV